jgi:hypothetical protein
VAEESFLFWQTDCPFGDDRLPPVPVIGSVSEAHGLIMPQWKFATLLALAW